MKPFRHTAALLLALAPLYAAALPDQSAGRPVTPAPPVTPNPSASVVQPPAQADQPDDPEPVKGSDPQPEQQGTVSKVFTWPVRGAVLRDFLLRHMMTCQPLRFIWWMWVCSFCALSDEKLEKAKSIISPNKFKEEDYECTDPEILEILSYYRITRDIAEGNN